MKKKLFFISILILLSILVASCGNKGCDYQGPVKGFEGYQLAKEGEPFFETHINGHCLKVNKAIFYQVEATIVNTSDNVLVKMYSGEEIPRALLPGNSFHIENTTAVAVEAK